MKSVLDGVTVIKSNRQGLNLKSLLTRARFNVGDTKGSFKCKTPRCKCCNDIEETQEVYFHKANTNFTINSEMSCESENLIYVIFCNACDQYYIGETGDKLRSRTRVHRQGLTNNCSIYVDRHIHTCAKSLSEKYRVIPFFKMKSNSRTDRLEKEAHFISKFKPELNRDLQ